MQKFRTQIPSSPILFQLHLIQDTNLPSLDSRRPIDDFQIRERGSLHEAELPQHPGRIPSSLPSSARSFPAKKPPETNWNNSLTTPLLLLLRHARVAERYLVPPPVPIRRPRRAERRRKGRRARACVAGVRFEL
ncbi:unnamed protein product [Linum trigynum]|uniref:Uncharacterized protein n=1 Tax=Linum trigynum TaxID=586398 RepID=A0AAV2FE81_9ROSI